MHALLICYKHAPYAPLSGSTEGASFAFPFIWCGGGSPSTTTNTVIKPHRSPGSGSFVIRYVVDPPSHSCNESYKDSKINNIIKNENVRMDEGWEIGP